MSEYEIRVLSDDGRPSMIYLEVHLSGIAAIRAARKIAAGHAFEVWRGLECIFTSQAEMPPPASQPRQPKPQA